MNVPVNYVAVLACGVASMVLGFLWYSPLLFGKPWMALMGLTAKKMEESKKDMPKTYGTMFVTALIMAYVLSGFVGLSQATTVTAGLQVGFWAWLGFVATVMLSNVLFGGKPVKLYLIDTTYQLVNLLIMGAILVSLR